MKNNRSYRTLIHIIIFILLDVCIIACSGDTADKGSDEQNKNAPGIAPAIKPFSSFGDTLIINAPSAVFFKPDSLQLEKIRSVNKKMVFESMTHDCFYQMRNARSVLKKYWPQVRIIETSKARYLLFIKVDKSKTGIDLNFKGDICGIFLFDPEKEPELIDMMNIDTALGFYFKK